jgi:hypothetical protein
MSQTLRPHTSDRAHGRMHYPWVVVAPRWICKMRYLINTYHIVVCYVLCWFSIFRLLVWGGRDPVTRPVGGAVSRRMCCRVLEISQATGIHTCFVQLSVRLWRLFRVRCVCCEGLDFCGSLVENLHTHTGSRATRVGLLLALGKPRPIRRHAARACHRVPLLPSWRHSPSPRAFGADGRLRRTRRPMM